MKIFLKKLKLSNVNKRYLSWLKDHETVKYTDQVFKKQSIKIIKNYIKSLNKSKFEFFFGIFVKEKNKNIHIGNIKLGFINPCHKTGIVSLIVGDKDYQGKKIGTKAIGLIVKKAKKIGLYKISAGCYKKNIASRKAFLRNHFKQEGVQKKQVLFENQREDYILYGLIL
jgi:[ribosomal protein S5]-alanine N-acetyltransferase